MTGVDPWWPLFKEDFYVDHNADWMIDTFENLPAVDVAEKEIILPEGLKAVAYATYAKLFDEWEEALYHRLDILHDALGLTSDDYAEMILEIITLVDKELYDEEYYDSEEYWADYHHDLINRAEAYGHYVERT